MFILIFIITLGILILIHEFGHFFAAKKFGIKVEEFGFGIPPRAIGKKIGETIYSLNWLPFGGFVRLLGEDEEDPKVLKNTRSFASQIVGKRITVVVAGVVMNLLLAWVLFWIVLAASSFKSQFPLIFPHEFIGVSQIVERLIVVGRVDEGSPAALAGIKPGDVIVSIGDEFVSDTDQFVEKIKSKSGKGIKITLSDIERINYRVVELTPRENPPAGQGAIGVVFGPFDIATLNYATPLQRIFSGPIHSYNMLTYSTNILGKIIASSIATQNLEPVSESVSGPFGIAAIVKEILSVQNPLLPYLNLLALLSLNLAVLNVVPFPGLDGGRLLFLLIEAGIGKRVHPTIEKYIHTVGLVVLIVLIILISISDIQKFIL